MTAKYRHGEWVKSVNALGEGLGDAGRSMISLDPETLMSAAQHNVGLDDFGEDDWFIEPLQSLCKALEDEAQLTLLGRLMARHEMQILLQNRLRIEDTLKRHPEILEQEIVAPIFVCGLGRSGTTVLHELLSEDPAHRVPQLWEMWHSTPPPERAGYDSDPRIDLADREINILPEIDLDFPTMHVNGGDKPNECIFIFGLQFLGDFFVGQYNVISHAIMTGGRDLTPVYRYHKKVLQLLQWRHRKERWVLKSPAHLGRLKFLFSVYPDARIVVTHRDPLRVMSSMSNLTTHLKAMRSDSVNPEAETAMASMGQSVLLDGYAAFREENPDRTPQIYDLRYVDLMKDQLGAVADIYAHWGLELSDDARQRMQRYIDSHPQGRHGTHSYSFDASGLDLDEQRAKFAAYQARFNVPSEV